MNIEECDQWILWRKELKNGKLDKIPTTPDGRDLAGFLQTEAWMSYAEAQEKAVKTGLQPGFVVSPDSPYFFLDLDKCITGGEHSDIAKRALEDFAGCAVYNSTSGQGLHIIGKYTGERPVHRCKYPQLQIELYTGSRFIAIGQHVRGSSSHDATPVLRSWIEAYFAVGPMSPLGAVDQWRDTPVPGWDGPEDDAELIKKALRSKSAASSFGIAVSFADLWRANADVLAKAYPPNKTTDSWDPSSADAALARHLSFWTGGNHERIYNIMLNGGSALKRDKWLRPDYLRQRTIPFAVKSTKEFYSTPKPSIPAPAPGSEIKIRDQGVDFMDVDLQISHFQGCTYIQSLNRVLTPRGHLLDSQRFRAVYGGWEFSLDSFGEHKTDNAWTAFTESHVIEYPMADNVCFRPNEPYDHLIAENGHMAANTWRPIPIFRKPGDPSRLRDHIKRMLPDKDDADILLYYMAACVQHQGVKFRWAPVLQGVQGNGKSILARCLQHAIGHRYVHTAQAAQLTRDKFNAWLTSNTLIIVNDMFIPGDRSTAMEVLKPMITENYLEIRRMQVAGITERVCANFFLTTNRKDGVPKTIDDRRFAVFFCAQQSVEHLDAHGLNPEYFTDLNDWLEGGGFGVLAEYLHTLDIPPKYNPARLSIRAPKTSSHDQAIAASRPLAEQVVLEAIELEVPGFRGGWISSNAALQYAQQRGVSLGPRKIAAVAAACGYQRCAQLPNGRSRRATLPDHQRPVLYRKNGEPPTAEDPVDCYEKAQGFVE